MSVTTIEKLKNSHLDELGRGPILRYVAAAGVDSLKSAGRNEMRDHFALLSIGMTILVLAASLSLLASIPWLAFIRLALWIGWLQIGSL